VFATEELEETARLYLMLRGLNPRVLSADQIDDLQRAFKLDLDRPDGDATPISN
jgi:hypothetical protein